MSLPEITTALIGSASVEFGSLDTLGARMEYGDRDPGHPMNQKGKFNPFIIVCAALIFTVVITWFETFRAWLEFYFLMDLSESKLLFLRARDYLYYAIFVSALAGILLLIVTKYWI